ncbi:PQQ-binding-like beta-propeller repeat protein [archaeon]|nr:PQQ-binding-like beta-propeller repeat protein [archaeon]
MKKSIFIFLGIILLILASSIVLANYPPELTGGGANPEVAQPGSLIRYSVVYNDADGDAPVYVRVYFPDGPKEMKKISGDYKTGAVYDYSQEQEIGFEYYFEASDGKATARQPAYEGGTLAPVNILTETMENNKIYLFSRESNEPILSYDTGSDWVNSVAISSDGEYIAVKTSDNIYLLSKGSNNPLWKYECIIDDAGKNKNPSGGIAISSDGGYIAGSCPNTLYLFSKKSNKPIWSYEAQCNVYNVDISFDGGYIVAGTMDCNELILFSKNDNKPIWEFKAQGDVHGLTISSDGYYIAAGTHCPDRRAYLFSKESNTPFVSYVASEDSPVWTTDISSDGKYAVYGLDSAGTYKAILLFSQEKNVPLKSWTTDWWVRSVGISSDGKYIAAGSGDYNIYLFDRDKDEPVWKFEAGERVGSVAISEDGNYIAAGSRDKNIYLFSKESNIPLWKYKTDSWVTAVAISGDGRYIIAGTGASQYLSEGHHPIYNPERGLKEEIAKETDAVIKESMCGDGMCEGTESYENCPEDCCPPTGCEEGIKEKEKPAEAEKEEKSFFAAIIEFFKRLFGR